MLPASSTPSFRAAEAVRRMGGRPPRKRLVEDLQGEFAKEFTGIDLNFSQYIQDNIEEGLSGVKGANSVKIIGPDLSSSSRLAGRSSDHEMRSIRALPTSAFSGCWASPISTSRSIAKRPPATGEYRRCQQRRADGLWWQCGDDDLRSRPSIHGAMGAPRPNSAALIDAVKNASRSTYTTPNGTMPMCR